MTLENPDKPLSGQIALVTGASRGIGYATARTLGAAGAHVVAVARTVGGLEELDDEIKAAGGHATLVPLDVTDVDGLDRMGAAIYERWGKLDILVANAGVLGVITPLAHLDPKDWQSLLDVNLTANWRLLRSMDPLLRQANAGRCLFLSSSVGSRPRAYWGGYAITKAGLEMMARTYALETLKTNVKVAIVNPGATRTAMRAKAMPGEDPSALPTPHDQAEKILQIIQDPDLESGAFVELADRSADHKNT